MNRTFNQLSQDNKDRVQKLSSQKLFREVQSGKIDIDEWTRKAGNASHENYLAQKRELKKRMGKRIKGCN